MEQEVWVLERLLDHEPGWIEGVYTSVEKAKAGAPDVTEWVKGQDRSVYQGGIKPYDPQWCITPYPLDPAFPETTRNKP